MSDLDALSRLYLFRSVPRSALEELLILAPPTRLGAGHTVFRQGSAADVALLLIEGTLAVEVESQGQRKKVGEVKSGEIVGEQGLFVPGGHRSATVVATTPAVCLLLSPELMDHAASNPAIVALERHLLGSLARRIRNTNQAILGAWKAAPAPAGPAAATPAAEPAPAKGGVRQWLSSLFGGA
jgi:CRP-like cAMP-binding protein